MSKLSAYQKLKQENERLKKELITVCVYPETAKAYQIKIHWNTVVRLEEAVFYGDCNKVTCHFEGFVPIGDIMTLPDPKYYTGNTIE